MGEKFEVREMPRQARLDVAGTLHHIVLRSIEKKQIFDDDLEKPILLLCMPQNENVWIQFAVIENIARSYSNELSVRVLEQEFIELFKENYHVVGTPT